MTDKEAMAMALEALEYIDDGANNQGAHTGISWRCVSNKAQPAITSLRQAIAEAEKQKPFGYFQYAPHFDAWVQNRDSNKGVAFYTHSPQREWVGLIHDEVPEKYKSDSIFIEGWLWAESKLKEKNQ